jgi:hypothetical protein
MSVYEMEEHAHNLGLLKKFERKDKKREADFKSEMSFL